MTVKGPKGYAKKNPDCSVAEEDFGKFDLSKFNEDILSQHQEKVALIYGLLFGFRGNIEFLQLLVVMVTEGHYGPDHPLFPNLRYRGVSDFTDKTLKISINCPYVRAEMEMGRFPVLNEDGKASTDPQDIGGCIDRFLKKLPNGLGGGRFFLRIKKDGRSFCNSPLGKDKITALLRSGFQRLDISNAETLHPHALRGLFITILANDPSVSVRETMGAARHTSVAANANYQIRNSHSESNRVVALIGPIMREPSSMEPPFSSVLQLGQEESVYDDRDEVIMVERTR